jgi:UDP-N-acetylmuramate dehydrogenase
MTTQELGILKNIPLASHTSWLIGGNAEYFAQPETLEELVRIQSWAQKSGVKQFILGGGTNILVPDEGLSGLVILLSKLKQDSATLGAEASPFTENEKIKFWISASAPKSELLKIFLRLKLAPACFLAGLPGQVGGGVVMNAGVSESLRPREFCEIVEAVEVLRPGGNLEIINGSALKWSYRHCDGWAPGVITRVKIAWENKPSIDLIAKVKELNQKRLDKQPLEWPSCGSVFRNPKASDDVHSTEKLAELLAGRIKIPQEPLKSAGALIEACGLKGKSIGGAQISEKHANFIINKGGAKAADVKALIKLCQEAVQVQFGITLQREVIYL